MSSPILGAVRGSACNRGGMGDCVNHPSGIKAYYLIIVV
ncbi:hypothetical protein D3OALGA1CA_2065 [Olavius algarvensis associated proteobacterium Delta 3]|nr:hypothetical protein D3OALGA1CA_2065 [Olavius algarvensis associated proteobacterium Delta 3]